MLWVENPEYKQLSPLSEATSTWDYRDLKMHVFFLFFFSTFEVSERIATICQYRSLSLHVGFKML